MTKINNAIQAADTADTADSTDLVATNENGQVKLTSAKGGTITVAAGTTNGAAAVAAVGFGAQVVTAKTTDQLVAEINANTSLTDKIRASNDNGKLRIENLSTTDLTVTGVAAGALSAAATTDTIGGNDVRKNLVKQFNELRDQLDKLADDASFNGTNLLRGDKLKLTFNETGTSTLEIQAKDINGNPTTVNAANLGVFFLSNADVDLDTNIDGLLTGLTDALGTLRSHASDFGSNLSIVENRTAFTKADGQYARDRRGQPGARRLERGGRQPACPADPPAALLHRPVARLAGRPGRAAAVRLADTTSRSVRRRRNHDTAAFFTVR